MTCKLCQHNKSLIYLIQHSNKHREKRKIIEDNSIVIKGLPPLKPIPNISLGKLIFDKLSVYSDDDEALVDAVNGESISYKTLLEKTCSLAESLKELGYGKNTIIAICSENCIDFFIPVIASSYIGAIMAPINHNYTKPEMIHALSISKPTIIFCSQEVYRKILEIKRKLTFIKTIIVINSKNKCVRVESIDDFTGKTSDLQKFEIVEVEPHEQVGFIMCSTGTTGLPKGVMITHENVITTFANTEDPRFMNQEEGRCTLGVLPFFHAYGMFRGLISIMNRIKIIVLKKFDEKLFLELIEKYKITTLTLVPPLALFLAKSPLVDKYDLSSVIEVSCGAAPLSKATEELLEERLKVATVRQSYGLTEATLRIMGMPIGHQKLGSSGKICPHILCKVRDPETGKSLGANQVGELCFKGLVVMKGYYNNEEATRSTFTSDGWLLSGDLGYYDEEEYFYIVDRIKELIKYKGFQVAPAELEAILLTNPKIKDAGVVGIPIRDEGELPLAFVVKNPDVELDEDEVKQFLAERVSSPKRLRGGVVFVEEIPKNPSGKILRRKLRELLKIFQYKSKL